MNTSTANDRAYDLPGTGGNPTALRPGQLVFLWPAEDTVHVDKPSVVQVEKATAHSIIGIDVMTRVGGQYEISDAAGALRWTWEVASAPPTPALDTAVTYVDRQQLSREERRQLLLGDQGALLVFHLDGGSSVAGVVTTVVYDEADNIKWLLVTSPKDSIKPYVARVQVDKIAHIMPTHRG